MKASSVVNLVMELVLGTVALLIITQKGAGSPVPLGRGGMRPCNNLASATLLTNVVNCTTLSL